MSTVQHTLFQRAVIFVLLFLAVAMAFRLYRTKNSCKDPDTNHVVHLIVIATEPDRADQLLASISNKKGYVVHTRGLGQTWTGYDFKLRHTLELAKKLPPDAVLMHLDAYDTYVMTDASEVLRKFKSMNADIVVSTETNLAPTWEFVQTEQQIKDMYPTAPNRFRWINSGTYMGYAGTIAKFLSSMPRNFHCDLPTGEKMDRSDDQRCFHTHFLREGKKYNIKLDYKQEIFHCMWDVHHYSIEPKRLYSETKSRPCVIHGNGQANSFRDVVAHIKMNNNR